MMNDELGTPDSSFRIQHFLFAALSAVADESIIIFLALNRQRYVHV